MIQFFLVGNANVLVLIVALICVFLAKEGAMFFPAHRAKLNQYRKIGIDHFHLIEGAYTQYKDSTEGLRRAYEAEIALPNRDLEKVKIAYEATRRIAETELGEDLVIIRDAVEQRNREVRETSIRAKKLDRVIGVLYARLDQERPVLETTLQNRRIPALKKLSPDQRQEIIDAICNLRFERPGESEYYRQIKTDLTIARDNSAGNATSLFAAREAFATSLAEPFESIWKDALEHTRTTRDQSRDNQSLPLRIRHRIRAGLASQTVPVRQQNFADVIELIVDAEHFDEFAKIFYVESLAYHLKLLKAYQSMPESALQKAETLLEGASGHFAEFLTVLRTPDPDLDAMLNAIPGVAMMPEQRILLFDLHRLEKGSDATIATLSDKAGQFVNPYPFHKRAQTNETLTNRFRAAVDSLKTKGPNELAKFPSPDSLQSRIARKELAAFEKNFEKCVIYLEATGKKLEEWEFDREWSWGDTLAAFVYGKTWSGDGEFQSFYGILPLLKGSFLVSIIAIVLSVPISVAAALYVDQLASVRERAILNPAMRLMGTIPPVVLGFLGIAVAGPLIRDFSASPIVSWIPGFPLTANLNMVTAGILLGFMACPIIFTLVSESLAKIPPTFREGALSLGASPLQVVFRVILPASLGGLLAAVVLGFSRVIGETMIVLLVIGKRTAEPLTPGGSSEPGHTMPGTIAQTLRGTPPESLDYHAVFMVGLVLFLITLIFNYAGRKTLARKQATADNL